MVTIPQPAAREAVTNRLKRRLSKCAVLVVVVVLAAGGVSYHFLGHSAAQSLPENCFSSPGSCGYPDPNYNNDLGPNAVGVADCNALPNFSTSDLPSGTYYSGSGTTLEITGNDVTINRMNMGDFNIYVASGVDNFTFENSCMATGDGTDNSVGIIIASGVTNTTIEDSTISGAGTNIASSTTQNGQCVTGAGVTGGALGIAVDNNGTGTTINGIYVYDAGGGAPGAGGGTNATLENSYEIINTVPACEHDEAVYFADISINLHHNVLFNEESQTAAVFGDTFGSGACDNNLTMTDNFIAGGDYVVYPCGNASSVGTSTMDIENNRFARCLTTPLIDSSDECSGGGANGSDSHGYYANGGFFGVAAYYYTGAGQTWSNNYWDDNLDQVNIDSTSGAPVADPGPAVALTGPIPDAGVSSTVSITATASSSSPATVHDVQFQADGTNIPNCDPTTPISGSTYTCAWNTTGFTNASHTIQAIVTDSNNQTANSSETVTVQNAAPTTYTIWHPSDTPVNADTSSDPAAINLGTKFQSNEAGYVLGVRFYKGSGNTGTHVGSLWTSTGSLLGSVTFTGETASGWQQALFSSPIAISANTIYIISYLAPNGNYAADHNYFNSSLTNGPLTALQNDDSGGDGDNGVYAYNSNTSFPNQSFSASNYWVDTVFTPAQYIAPTISFTAPTSGATVTGAEAITANVTSNSGATIGDVQFQADGTNIPNCNPTTPNSGSAYVCSVWDTTGLTNGAHTIQTVVTDSNGVITTGGETVTVNNPTPAVSINANPATITTGGSSTLTWNSTNATSCTASGDWGGGQATNNTNGYTVNPATTSTYTLTCSGPGGVSAPASATVTVASPANPISSNGSSNKSLSQGKSTGKTAVATVPTTTSDTTSPDTQNTGQSTTSSQAASPSTEASGGITSQTHPPQLRKTSKRWQYIALAVFGVACIGGAAFGLRYRRSQVTPPESY